VQAGNVAAITSQGDTIQGMFKNPVPDPNPPAGQQPQQYTLFPTTLPSFIDQQTLEPFLEQNNVFITADPLQGPNSTLVNLLLSFGPVVLLIDGVLWLSRRAATAAGGGRFGLRRSRARRYDPTGDNRRITFADVAGIDEVKADLAEVVGFLRQPDKYQRLDGTIPKGVPLVGPPGTGKTLLARGRRRGGRALLLDERLRVHRDGRRRRSLARARPLRPGQAGRHGDHLPRRAGRHRPPTTSASRR
jgi:cell division protease FtsH